MRLLLLTICILATTHLSAQDDDGWIAPEGFILNYRTLTWNDFQGKEEKEHAEKLAQRHLQAQAYVCPAIYFTADSGEKQANGRIKFKFHTKCAFQSRAFVRESTKQEHSNYVLIHEQDHYDIALTYTIKLEEDLSSRDYSADKYQEEIDKIGNDLLDKYYKTQETYDHEVNPEGRDDKPMQYLWDMRIKKGMDNASVEYYSSPESAVQAIKFPGQVVKRLEGEPNLQFVVRARPLYVEFPKEMMSKVISTTEWSATPSLIAFYTQKYYVEEDGALPKDHYRTLGYIFIPTAKDMYKRVFIDTFNNNGLPVKITGAFFANADSDNVKELVVMATSVQKDEHATGTRYFNRIYDNVARPLSGRLKKLDPATTKIEDGFEGQEAGKASKAKYKSEKEITDALKKAGYN